jgi:glucosamine-6-phosphate deaminase
MYIDICENRNTLGMAAADIASSAIAKAIEENGTATVIFATGASQFDFLQALTTRNLAWEKVRMFHLDEYIALPENHPASFRRYLKERLLSRTDIEEYYLINGEADPNQEVQRMNGIISRFPVDLACVGIGENGHLAFNDPPADFAVEDPYIVVDLDERCKRQQMGEGWFKTLEDVPDQAISMSVKQIMKARKILCTVPGSVKAEAVHSCFDLEISPDYPASILRRHPDCHAVLDVESAALLQNR